LREVIILNKNILVIGITILFIINVFTPISLGNNVNISDTIEETFLPTYNGNTLYVGGTGEGNYSSIQDAIDNASIGDTVFVYDESSPYYEQLLISKTINLVGENKYTTIIDAQHEDDAVEISNADNCFVSGFTIKNCRHSGTEYSHAVVSIFRSDYVIIKGNILTIGDLTHNDWTCAVELDNCTYCIIQKNFIFEDDYKGSTVGIQLLDGSSHNTISGNDISNYTVGVGTFRFNINLHNNYNIISGNHIHHNLYGIEILGDMYNEILNNRIEYNEAKGIDCTEAHHTTISGNIISYNGESEEFDCGIMITWFTYSNYISDNVISNNNPTGIYMLTGIDNVVIRNNFIDNWGDSGTTERWWGNAFFNYEMFQWRFLRLNRWWRNYWSDHSGIFPKAIRGDMEILGLFYFPRLEFDWFPRIISYDIETP